MKINLKFYFHFYVVLKKLYEGLYGIHKIFWGTTKKYENKSVSSFFLFVRDQNWEG